MTKPQKALPIFLTLVLISGSWMRAQKVDEDEFEGFEDNLLVLTQLSEQITIDQLSLKTFRCQERIVVLEKDNKTQAVQKQESTHTFTVIRKRDQRVNEKLIFSETRDPGLAASALPQMPPIDEPFTGKWLETFSFENRLANDFKKLPAEQIQGKECDVFSFETVPQISGTKIVLLGKPLPLKQRGRIWVDKKTFQLVRLIAKQIKLPKGCRSYEYRIDFLPQRLFGRNMAVPVRTESTLSLKDKTFEVTQEYSRFEMM